MKKILIITNHSYMLWQFRRELIARLMEDHEVVLSMPFVGHEEDFRAMGLRCIETELDRRGINPRRDLQLMRVYEEQLKAERPDLVITYSIKPNIYAGLVCGKLGIPFCANVQGLGTAFQRPGLAQLVTVLYRAALRKARVVFFENQVNAEEFRRRHILPARKQKVLMGAGINLEHYGFCPYPEEETTHFLYLGRIMKEKGMDQLFSAVERLAAEGEAFHLDLVGFFEDEYKDWVDRLAADGIATFHGFQEDPRPYYGAASCVVQPSYHEGLSNVLLEAAATGRPIITTNIPGCREAVDDGQTGILVEVKSTESLYQGMKKFLSLSRQERAEMGRQGREKMAREFEKSAVVEETIGALGLEEKLHSAGKSLAKRAASAKEKTAARGLTPAQRRYLPLKRAIDVAAGGVACVLLAPVMGALAVAIKLDSPGPILFKQKRVGQDKEFFEIWKFRTMRTDTPKDVPTHMLENPDAYITRTGRFMRKYSLDELPQFLQVMTSQLSIVGPRPALWNQDDLVAERDKYGANGVKPGITGWAQINGRDELEIPVKARFDGQYVRDMSLRMDVKCFMATIGSVLNHDGVKEGGTGEMHKEGEQTGDGSAVLVSKEKIDKEVKIGAAVVAVGAVVGVAAIAGLVKRRKR